MKISILCPDLSINCLGRSYLLAKILQQNYDVEIVGPLLYGDKIWKPLANNKGITFKYLNFRQKFNLNPFVWFSLYQKIDGDIIYASKPYFSSFGLGIIKKIFEKKKLILDIDDWDKGFHLYSLRNAKFLKIFKILIYSIIDPMGNASIVNAWFFEQMVFLADLITVSNHFLLNKFGGEIIVHGRDSKNFNPAYFNKTELRKKFNLPVDTKIISFIGTPHPYKGVEDLIYAFGSVKSNQAFLLIVGLGTNDYAQKIKRLASKIIKNNRFKLLAQQSFDILPEFVALSDVVVIPQRDNIATRGQLPAKIFDAMSLEIPIITTALDNIRDILKNNAWYFTPGNISELTKQIDFVLENYNEAKEVARISRVDFVQNYSWDALVVKIETLLSKIKGE